MEFEFAKKTCPRCKESKIAIISFSLTGRICRDCVKEEGRKKKSREPDVMKKSWKGRSWGSKATELGQAMNAVEFCKREYAQNSPYLSGAAFR